MFLFRNNGFLHVPLRAQKKTRTEEDNSRESVRHPPQHGSVCAGGPGFGLVIHALLS